MRRRDDLHEAVRLCARRGPRYERDDIASATQGHPADPSSRPRSRTTFGVDSVADEIVVPARNTGSRTARGGSLPPAPTGHTTSRSVVTPSCGANFTAAAPRTVVERAPARANTPVSDAQHRAVYVHVTAVAQVLDGGDRRERVVDRPHSVIAAGVNPNAASRSSRRSSATLTASTSRSNAKNTSSRPAAAAGSFSPTTPAAALRGFASGRSVRSRCTPPAPTVSSRARRGPPPPRARTAAPGRGANVLDDGG